MWRETDSCSFVRVLFHRIRVLAFDAANGLLVTSNDVDAYLAYLSFLYQLAFHKQVAFSRRDHRKMERASPCGRQIALSHQDCSSVSAQTPWPHEPVHVQHVAPCLEQRRRGHHERHQHGLRLALSLSRQVLLNRVCLRWLLAVAVLGRWPSLPSSLSEPRMLVVYSSIKLAGPCCCPLASNTYRYAISPAWNEPSFSVKVMEPLLHCVAICTSRCRQSS